MDQDTTQKPKTRRKAVQQDKCKNCGHSVGSHATRDNRPCKNRKCQCIGYELLPDINKHNTANGKPPVVLYAFQKQYLAGMPEKHIMAADTGCFAKGTRVLMWDKTYKNIEDVVAGDRVVSTDDRGLMYEGIVDFMAYTPNKPKPMIQFSYGKARNRTTITATYDHPFWDGEKYYPLYEFVWREMAPHSRVQLQLLCEQYGTPFNYAPSRGLSYSDNPTSERQFWALANSAEWENGQGTPSGSTNVATKPQQAAVHQPQRLRPDEQPYRQSGMVFPETKLNARVDERTLNKIARECSRSAYKILRPDYYRNTTALERAYRRHSDNRLAYQTKTIRGFSKIAPQYSALDFAYNRTETIDVSTARVLSAQPYYSIGIKNRHHTYVVETLPVHNTGKTMMALAHYDSKAYLKPLLILAPASKVNTGDWERDMLHYFASRMVPEYEIYSYEKFSRVPSVKEFKANGNRGIWRNWLQRHPSDFAIIADEIHKAKNPQSKMGKALFEVSQSASFFTGLSATPLPNGWIDAANYFKMFGFSKNITEFKRRYCEIQTYKGFPEIVRYYHEGELADKWNKIAKPLSKQKALDLPPITVVPVPLPAGPEYVKVQKSRLFEDKFLDNPSALLHALRQSIVAPKVAWLNEFLEGVSDHTVVFYNYRRERDDILAMLKKYHPKRLVLQQDGERHEVPRKDEWGQLPERTITLAQYQSGSTGIEMTYAATTVYFSPTYSYSNYEQSIGRTNRNGQTRKMTLYLLCAPATVEKEVWAALRNKSDFQVDQWVASKIESGEISESPVY